MKHYMRAESLFLEAFRTVGPGVGAGRILVVIEFCPCLSLFMDIGRISEIVETLIFPTPKTVATKPCDAVVVRLLEDLDFLEAKGYAERWKHPCAPPVTCG